jgi:hypothetical protein
MRGVTAKHAGGCLVVTAVVVAGCSACEPPADVLDVVLEVVPAAAVADDLQRDVAVGFSFVDDAGGADGLGAEAGEGFSLSPDTERVAFTVRVDKSDYTSLVALGRTGFLSVRDDDKTALTSVRARVLLASIDRPGLFVDVPVALGGDECVATDEAGRGFLVGGSAGNQGGYVVDDFVVSGLVDADLMTRQRLRGCGAHGGSVAAVVGCEVADAVVVVAGARSTQISLGSVETALGRPVSCTASRVAPVASGVWFVDGQDVFFVADDGTIGRREPSHPAAGATAGFSQLVTTGTAAVVIDGVIDGVGDGVLRVIDKDEPVRKVREGLGAAARVVRRGGGLLLLDGAQLLDLHGVVVRDDVPAGVVADAVDVVVLSDDTVVVLASRELRVAAPGTLTTTMPLATSRSGLLALPGDTLLLLGGNERGIDVVVLGDHQVVPTSRTE